MFFTKLKNRIRNVRRLKEIARVFTKYGLSCYLRQFSFHAFAPKDLPATDVCSQPLHNRIRIILEELGPTFIKFGQMLSLHPDIIPPELCRELEKLQDGVNPVEFKPIKKVLEDELKQPIEDIFDDFSPIPLASASLAQVYKVTLGNKEAIVKILKPHLEEIIRADLEILEFLARHLDKHSKEARVFNPKGLVEEFKTHILTELDFNNEAVNIETFRRNFRYDRTVHIPIVYDKLCTDKVLVIEYIKGIKLNDVKKPHATELDTKKIAHALTACLLKQIFVDGFFHADPHPGNIFILPDGKISFVDFGVVGRIDDEAKFAFAHLFVAAAAKDPERMIKVLQQAGATGYTNETRLKLSLQQLLDKYYGITLEEFNMGGFLRDLTKVLYENKVHIPQDNFLLIKSLSILESEAKMLDPELNYALEIRRVSERIIKDEFSASRVMKKIGTAASDIFGLIQNLPKDLIMIIDTLRKGELKIGFEHLNLEKLISMLDKGSNRLSFSLITAALIIGSSLLINTNTQTFMGPSYHLGTMGFVAAATLGFWLVVSILRSGKL